MLQDFRFALRQLRRTPVFAAVTIAMLALGIGANTAVFSVMNAVVLRWLPVSHPEQLVFLHTTDQPSRSSQTGYDDTSLTLPIYEQLRSESSIFSDLIAFVPLDINRAAIRYGSDPETARADMVSGNFFSGLGVRMARGRAFTPDDERQYTQTVVLSHGFWTRRFARNPAIVGDTLFVKGVPFTVIGVAAPEFTGVEHNNATDLWIPIQDRLELKPWGRPAESEESFYGSPNWWFLMTIGRLTPGTTQAQALAKAQPIFQRAAYSRLGTPGPQERVPKVFFSPARGIQGLRDSYRQPLTILMTMVGVVLLIACGNVSMLLAARNAARQREFSLRTALSGSRARLFRQLVTESLALVAAGTALGWLFAIGATRALAAWSAFDVAVAPDGGVLAFTLAISIAAALVFGLAPLVTAARAPIGLVLKTSGTTTTADRGKTRTGQAIVAAQIALCLVLLVGAALLVRTLQNLNTVDLGFRASGLVVFGVTPPQTVRGDEAIERFYQSLMTRLRTLPCARASFSASSASPWDCRSPPPVRAC